MTWDQADSDRLDVLIPIEMAETLTLGQRREIKRLKLALETFNRSDESKRRKIFPPKTNWAAKPVEPRRKASELHLCMKCRKPIDEPGEWFHADCKPSKQTISKREQIQDGGQQQWKTSSSGTKHE